MNRWACDQQGCRSEAVGEGGAIGLRALGWSVEFGAIEEYLVGLRRPRLLCPVHRTDSVPCVESDENQGNPCPVCAAEADAKRYQEALYTEADRQILLSPGTVTP